MPEDPAVINEIIERHRARRELHRAEKSMTLRIKAICRRLCWGVLCGGEKCKTAVGKAMCSQDAAEAAAVYKGIQKVAKMVAMAGADSPEAATRKIVARNWAEPFFAARDVLKASRTEQEKHLRKLAETLAAWPWCEGINGIGRLALAQIVGEAGDLANYDAPAKLWKRMGLAVIDGKSQRRVKDPEQALEQGYNPSRRSTMFTIGDCLIKKQNAYRELYLARKEYYTARDPEASKILNHRRAQRYMEKRLLKHLWRVWRGKPAEGVHEGVSRDGEAYMDGPVLVEGAA